MECVYRCMAICISTLQVSQKWVIIAVQSSCTTVCRGFVWSVCIGVWLYVYLLCKCHRNVIIAILFETGRVFLMRFIVGVISYMEVSNKTSDTH